MSSVENLLILESYNIYKEKMVKKIRNEYLTIDTEILKNFLSQVKFEMMKKLSRMFKVDLLSQKLQTIELLYKYKSIFTKQSDTKRKVSNFSKMTEKRLFRSTKQNKVLFVLSRRESSMCLSERNRCNRIREIYKSVRARVHSRDKE